MTTVRIRIASFVFVFSILCLFNTTALATNNYGSSTYNNSCDYNGQCPTPSPVPAVSPQTLPNGLKVIINLVDKQSIPPDGFVIKITQLTGTGSSTLKSATFSIDGKEITTVASDTTNTVTWKWDPKVNPGTHVHIVVTASDNTTSSYDYTVTMAPVTDTEQKPTGQIFSPGSTTNRNNSGNNSPVIEQDAAGPVGVLLKAIIPESVKQAFRALPPVAVNTFPYLLFAALGGLVLVLFLQIRRELKASDTILASIEKEKLMIELKNNFIGLASHYLRTPVTLILGSIDLMANSQVVAKETLSELKAAADQLSEHVKGIIANQESASLVTSQPQDTKGSIRIGVAISVIVVAVIFALFNLLAYASGRAVPFLNFLTQLIVFAIVGFALYQVERRFTLRKLETEAQNNVLNLQQQLQTGRDTFLERVATDLYQDHQSIAGIAKKAASDPNFKTLDEGISRLASVVEKCRTAQSVKGSRSTQSPTLTDIKTIFDHSDPKLSEQILAKKINFIEPTKTQLNVQEPSLIQVVTRSVIDNAVAYSPEGGTVTLSANSVGPTLALTIADKGRGISKDRNDLLFQPLSKVEGYENFDHEGMGFSLYLDKLIMEYLGGSIDLQSEQDKGTTVSLKLPAAA